MGSHQAATFKGTLICPSTASCPGGRWWERADALPSVEGLHLSSAPADLRGEPAKAPLALLARLTRPLSQRIVEVPIMDLPSFWAPDALGRAPVQRILVMRGCIDFRHET